MTTAVAMWCGKCTGTTTFDRIKGAWFCNSPLCAWELVAPIAGVQLGFDESKACMVCGYVNCTAHDEGSTWADLKNC